MSSTINKFIIQDIKVKKKPYTKKRKSKYKGGTRTTTSSKLNSTIECYCPLVLEKNNPNDRDKNIVFMENGHQYYINGDSNYISVTSIVHRIFPPFDTDGLIEKLLLDKNPKYIDKTPETIKLEWKKMERWLQKMEHGYIEISNYIVMVYQ